MRIRTREAVRRGRLVEAARRIPRPVDRLKRVKVALAEIEEVREGIRAGRARRRRVHGEVVRVGPELVAADSVWASQVVPAGAESVLDEVQNTAEVVAVRVARGALGVGWRAGNVSGEAVYAGCLLCVCPNDKERHAETVDILLTVALQSTEIPRAGACGGVAVRGWNVIVPAAPIVPDD